jgi:subfamily B ATP-binding cassette protein MsbA
MGFLRSVLVATREPLVMVVVVSVIIIQVNVLGGDFASILLSLLFFYRSLNALMGVQTSWNSFLNFSGSIENAKTFIEELDSKKEVFENEVLDGFKDRIELKNVNFNYVEGVNTLRNINLSIRKNESIAVVGESGSGKTTIVNMIAGLLYQYEGLLSIDSNSYGSFDIKGIQEKIGYITQEPVIFSDTLFNNITFWASKTKENVSRFNEVLKKSALLEFVEGLPQKEDTNLGDTGIQISGGQKQRVSIARELFKEVELLLLDEATSALDSNTEMIIQKNIDSLKGKFTMVIVAHRLSTIRNADRIVVMEQGEIEAIGSFDELLLSNSRFKKMVELQEF